MLHNDRRLKLWTGALLAVVVVVLLASSPTTNSKLDQSAVTTSSLPTNTTVLRQGVIQVAPTATTPTGTSSVDGVVLSHTGSTTLPLFIAGVASLLCGIAVELRSRRRRGAAQRPSLQVPASVGIAGVLVDIARIRRDAAPKCGATNLFDGWRYRPF